MGSVVEELRSCRNSSVMKKCDAWSRRGIAPGRRKGQQQVEAADDLEYVGATGEGEGEIVERPVHVEGGGDGLPAIHRTRSARGRGRATRLQLHQVLG